MSLSGIISNGSIILFTSLDVPPEFGPPTVPAGDQPYDQRVQGYPQAQGLIVIHKVLTAAMGVHVDELMQ